VERSIEMDTTLLKGLNVLEALIRSDRPRGVSEFSTELGLTKSNVHRVLQTLQAAGFVGQSDSGSYAPTLKIWELGAKVYLKLDIPQEARPFLLELANLTHETVHLSVLDGTEVVYLDKIDSTEPVRAYSTIGGRAPAHCVATGKALLAFIDDAAAHKGSADFPLFTPRTITTRQAFEASCADIRAKGYAINWGEWREQVRGVAAPVRDAYGSIVAAVGISGPADRLTHSRIIDAAPHVVETAMRISKALGYGPKGKIVQRRA
jgi:DNA-binding IclR family transcriptional regulator